MQRLAITLGGALAASTIIKSVADIFHNTLFSSTDHLDLETDCIQNDKFILSLLVELKVLLDSNNSQDQVLFSQLVDYLDRQIFHHNTIEQSDDLEGNIKKRIENFKLFKDSENALSLLKDHVEKTHSSKKAAKIGNLLQALFSAIERYWTMVVTLTN